MPVDPGSRRSARPLLPLQALRAIAAFLMLVHHAGDDADAMRLRLGARTLPGGAAGSDPARQR